MIGRWSTEGYQFEHSDSIIDGQFVGLVLDQRGQPQLTEERIKIRLRTNYTAIAVSFNRSCLNL
jgi:flavodoxin I